MSSTIEILIIFLLIIVNGILVMSEMAIVSSRKVRLQQLAKQGDAKAQVALQLANEPNQFLSTVQAGITLIVILSGAVGEKTIAQRLDPLVALVPEIKPYSSAIATAMAIAIVTYLTLIIGELVPKRLALTNPERIASTIAIPMQAIAKIAAPIVNLLSCSTDLVMLVLGIRPSTEPEITEEEIRVLIEQGTEAGTFEEAEQDMLERVFRLGDRRVSALMTPRPDMVWLDLDDSPEANQKQITASGHSRFPVCQGELDNILGIVHVNEVLSHCLVGDPFNLTESLRQPLFLPESTRGLKVLEVFKQTGTQMAIVVDEYGVIQGLVTLNDILEEIVGDIPSVQQLEEPQIVQREDGSWLLDGMLAVDEFFELFDIDFKKISGEQRSNYHTLGGFVVMHFGSIPSAADHFEWGGLRLEVMDMDGNRVDKVLVMPLGNQETAEENG